MPPAEPGSRHPQGPSLHLVSEQPVLGVLGSTGSDDAPLRLAAADAGRVVDLGGGRSLLWALARAPRAGTPRTGAASVGVFATTDDSPAAVEHLGLRVAAARRAGLLGPTAKVLVVGDPPRPGAWGFGTLAAGTTLDLCSPDSPGSPGSPDSPTTPDSPATSARPAATLVLGGVGSGKSAYAELLLAPEPRVTYVATGRPPLGLDPEWDAKVLAHRARRPDAWASLEVSAPEELAPALSVASGHLLWDSAGSWLTAVLDACGAWDRRPGWREGVDDAVATVVEAYRTASAVRVVVAEEVGWGVVPATASGRLFQHELGRLNQRLAAVSDAVHLIVAGRVLDLTKGLP